MTRSTIWRRAAAVLAVGALAVVGGAGAAQAAPTIDFGETGSITVHKRLNATGPLLPGNGLPDDSAPGTPLGDIEFSLQTITSINLRTTDGWKAARALSLPTGDLSSHTLAPVDPPTSPQTTAADGIATFANLPVGAYLVTENLTDEQVADGIAPAAPFVVTVPMTHPTDLNTWIYNIHVYPKNLQSIVTKTVNDGETVGDTIDWTISTQVPAQRTTTFAFKDELVEHLIIPERLADNVVVTLGGTKLVEADYNLEYDPYDPDTGGNNTLWVSLTAEGLVKLNAAAGSDEHIAVTFTTEVLSLPENGIITNSAALFPNESFSEAGPGIVTREVVSPFGQINITKEDADTRALLAGAEFKVFRSLDDANAYAAGEDDFVGDPAEYAALPLRAYQNGTTGDLTDTFVTGADGTVSITGLRASNWQDGALLTDREAFQYYWILETKAPAGYELSTAPFGPIEVLFDDASTVLPSVALPVPNVAKPELPLTGGQIATGVFGLLGALVLTGGVLLVIRARRQDAGA